MIKSGKPTVSDPQDSVLWCKEAVSRKNAGDEKAALYCYNEAIKLKPDNADVWYNILYLSEQTGDKASALAAACTAEKVFPKDYRFPAEQARFFAECGKISDALKAADRAININPNISVLHSNKAGYLLISGKNEEALEESDIALKIDSTNNSAMLHKAHSLAKLERFSEAEQILDTEILKSDIRAIKMLINICIRNNNLIKAKTLSISVTETAPNDDEAWALRGITHAYLKEKNEAIFALTKAIKINPKEKSYRTNLTMIRKQ